MLQDFSLPVVLLDEQKFSHLWHFLSIEVIFGFSPPRAKSEWWPVSSVSFLTVIFIPWHGPLHFITKEVSSPFDCECISLIAENGNCIIDYFKFLNHNYYISSSAWHCVFIFSYYLCKMQHCPLWCTSHPSRHYIALVCKCKHMFHQYMVNFHDNQSSSSKSLNQNIYELLMNDRNFCEYY